MFKLKQLNLSKLAITAIELLQYQLSCYKIRPIIHFELEGCYQPDQIQHPTKLHSADFTKMNQRLRDHSILGIIKPEFWQYQWEYASCMNDQSPLRVASDLNKFMHVIPQIMAEQGIANVIIKPVVWSGDSMGYHQNSSTLFCTENKAIHIPNAVQINISARDTKDNNILTINQYGENLQTKLLETSYECSLLFLPDNESFQRLQLKTNFNLSSELTSPQKLSGGHQGSIAFYTTHDKHNRQITGRNLVNKKNQTVAHNKEYWRQASRIEHRLGASSYQYNPYVNIAFVLANMVESSQGFLDNNEHYQIEKKLDLNNNEPWTHKELARSLLCEDHQTGAIKIFQQSKWLEDTINKSACWHNEQQYALNQIIPDNLGTKLKKAIIEPYQLKITTDF